MKKLTIILIAFVLNATAQEYKLGKVTLAELEEKQHPKDPSAEAAVLFKVGEVRFEYSQENGFEMFTKVKTKIKIYKKEGLNWANKSVQYFIGNSSSKESVSFDDAISYNIVGGKIEKTKLKSEGEFEEKVNKYWALKKITMPNVKEGSIIEFEYTLRSPNIGSLDEWSFQTSIPVNYSEFKTYVPEYYVYNPYQKGSIFPKVTKEQNNRKINYVYTEKANPGLNGRVLSSRSNEALEFVETKTTYIAENLPAMKDESFVNNIDNYISSVSHELTMIKNPNRPIKSLSTDWESVVKTIYENDDFGTELNKTGYFEDDLKTVIAGLTTFEEKASAIFGYVKSKVKWNNYTSYYCRDGVRKAYKDGVGNVAEINLMLTAMLRHVGINANPVLISTRSNGIAYFPNRTAYNYVIAGIETADGLILLDATEKFSTANVLPNRDLNWFGRLIRNDKTSIEVGLTPTTLSKEVVNLALDVKKDGIIDGKIKRLYTNNLALDFRKKHLSTNKDNYIESLENKNNNIEISDYSRDNETDLSTPISETFSFKSSKDVEIIGDKIYFSSLLFLAPKENPFKQETREYPIDFGFPMESRYNINIKIPEGYVVESLPAPINIATGENVGSFKYIIAQNENNIQIVITETINQAIVQSDFYPVLKDFFKQVVDKQNEKIVLKKM